MVWRYSFAPVNFNVVLPKKNINGEEAMFDKRKTFLLTILFSFIFVSINCYAAGEEQKLLNSSNFIFVDLPNKYKEIKSQGKEDIKVWREVVSSVGNVKSLSIEYDKKWVLENTLYFSDYEARVKYKGQLDIHEVFWKNNEIQAYVVKKYYPAHRSHKVTDIFSRSYMLGRI